MQIALGFSQSYNGFNGFLPISRYFEYSDAILSDVEYLYTKISVYRYVHNMYGRHKQQSPTHSTAINSKPRTRSHGQPECPVYKTRIDSHTVPMPAHRSPAYRTKCPKSKTLIDLYTGQNNRHISHDTIYYTYIYLVKFEMFQLNLKYFQFNLK